MNREPLVKFARERGLAVLATRGPDGTPQAALVGTAASDQAEIIFDTSIRSRKYRNIRAHDRVALVIGWDDEVTVQCEGVADMPGRAGPRPVSDDLHQAVPGEPYTRRGPRDRPVRVRPDWARYSDYRPASFTVHEVPFI